VRIEDVPRDVRHTIDAEAHGHNVLAVQQVRHGDREFYRATIEQHLDADKVIRVGPDGRLFSVEEAADAAWVLPHHDIVEEEIRATVEHPDRIGWERIPPRARAALLRLGETNHLDEVVVYRDRDHAVFQANVKDPEDGRRTLVIRVGYDGHIIDEAVVGGPRIEVETKDIRFSEAPPEVREAIAHESEGVRIDSLHVEIHHGQPFYYADFPYRHAQRWVTIDSHGHVVNEVVQ
jgi:hypothetical protein